MLTIHRAMTQGFYLAAFTLLGLKSTSLFAGESLPGASVSFSAARTLMAG